MTALQVFIIVWFGLGVCLAPLAYVRTQKYWRNLKIRDMRYHSQMSFGLVLYCWFFIFPVLHYTKINNRLPEDMEKE